MSQTLMIAFKRSPTPNSELRTPNSRCQGCGQFICCMSMVGTTGTAWAVHFTPVSIKNSIFLEDWFASESHKAFRERILFPPIIDRFSPDLEVVQRPVGAKGNLAVTSVVDSQSALTPGCIDAVVSTWMAERCST